MEEKREIKYVSSGGEEVLPKKSTSISHVVLEGGGSLVRTMKMINSKKGAADF